MSKWITLSFKQIAICVRVFVRLLRIHELLGNGNKVVIYMSAFMSKWSHICFVHMCCLCVLLVVHVLLIVISVRWLFTFLCSCWSVSFSCCRSYSFVCVSVCVCVCVYVCAFVVCVRWPWKFQRGGCLRVCLDFKSLVASCM